MAIIEFYVGSHGPYMYDDAESYTDEFDAPISTMEVIYAPLGTATLDTANFNDVGINNSLKIKNATVPPASEADMVKVYAYDYAPGDSRMYIATEASGDLAILGNGQLILADSTLTDFVSIDQGGEILFGGASKRHLTVRPAFVAGRIGGLVKPTPVTLGTWAGYSMPIFAANDEELFWRTFVPGRWDGASDIKYSLLVCLELAETTDDDFKFQLSWNHSDGTTGVIDNASVADVEVAQNCDAGHEAQYSVFILEFTIDWDLDVPDIMAGDILTGRVRRIASGGVEIAGEVIVLDHWVTFQVDKVFKA